MPSSLPKLQAYIEPSIWEKYLAWKQEQGTLSHSEAVSRLFQLFFMGKLTESTRSEESDQMAVIEARLTERIKNLEQRCERLEQAITGDIPSDIPGDSPVGGDGEAPAITGDISSDIPGDSPVGGDGEAPAITGDIPGDIPGDSPVGGDGEAPAITGDIPSDTPSDTPSNSRSDSLGGAADAGTLDDSKEGLIGTALARRLKISPSQVTKLREKPHFESWSRLKDPQGVGWRYDTKQHKYFSVSAATSSS